MFFSLKIIIIIDNSSNRMLSYCYYYYYYYLHFHSFHFDSPSTSALVKNCLQYRKIINININIYIWNPKLTCHPTNTRTRLILNCTCIELEIDSRSDKISCKLWVPNILRSVVWANSRVEWWAFSTLATETVALWTR